MPAARRRSILGICLVGAMLGGLSATVVAAEAEAVEATACRAEIEPNDSPAEAFTLEGATCVSGTLVDVGDQDVFIWQVDSEAAASTWSLSLRGVPGTVSTARVVGIDTDAGSAATELGAEIGRVATEAGGTAATTATDLAVEAGTYAIFVDRTDPATGDVLTDDRSYELRLSPSMNADAGSAAVDAVTTARIVVGTTGETAPALGDGVAVELLLDTSGSMLERLGQTTKLEVAERSLTQLVDTLPAGLTVALRTFKAEPRSCATVLRVPAGPLRPKAMKQTIRDLPTRKGTRTPIAKAISKVPQDMQGVEGHRIVVLVTDGKEDCGGDPASAIAALAESGYTSAVHIIGYALPDDEEVGAALAEWAALGSGRYFEAPDRASLDAAIASVVAAPYLVFDSADVLVAQGVVGDQGVELEAGTYRVEILADPLSSEVVELEAGAVVEVPVGSGDAAAA